MRLICEVTRTGGPGTSLAFGAAQQKSSDCLSWKESVSFCNLKHKVIFGSIRLEIVSLYNYKKELSLRK